MARRWTTGRSTPARLALPSDRSFADYETAIASIRGAPLSDDTELYRNQALLDVIVRYPLDR